MKVKILTDIIRKVVNEEVRKVVRTEIRKVLSEGNVSRPISKKSNKVQYTKNKSLNDILNETAGGIPQDATMASMEQNIEQQMEEYPTMNNKTYNSGDLASLMGYGDMNQGNPKASVEQTFREMGKEVDPTIAKAMTRNYGDLMKAIDKKKGK